MDVDQHHESRPHVVFIPFMAQGHMIPMVDMARLFARHGAIVTIITTPLNAARFTSVIEREIVSGHSIRLHTVVFLTSEAGLPDGCESVDLLPSGVTLRDFFYATYRLQDPVESFLNTAQPRPRCIVGDMSLPWTSAVAHKLGIPKFIFHGFCSFALLCLHNIRHYNLTESVNSDWEPFSIPGLPEDIKFTKDQIPPSLVARPECNDIRRCVSEGELTADGVLVNTFDALEPCYISEYQRATGKKVWTLGPLSLSNTTAIDKAERGNKAVRCEDCLRWLDSKNPNSVIYVCFGSENDLTTKDLIEVGLGLEASNHNFIWVIRPTNNSQDIDRWLMEEKFEERVKDRGQVIKGWAPQVLILSHPSIGAFFTHCGWNSTLEGVCAGVPMATWPMFAEQFFNEKVIVNVLQVGVSLGVIQATRRGAEMVGGLVEREGVKKAVERVMEEGAEGEERRKRARDLGEKAKRAIEEGGSSYTNVDLFLENVMNYGSKGMIDNRRT